MDNNNNDNTTAASGGPTPGTAAAPIDERRLDDFADLCAEWFWEMDAQLRFTWLSANVECVTGIAREDHYGKTHEQLGLPDAVDPAVWRRHQRTLTARRPFRDFAYCRPGPDRTPLWLSTSGVPVYDDAGRFVGYRGTGRKVAGPDAGTSFRPPLRPAAPSVATPPGRGVLVVDASEAQRELLRLQLAAWGVPAVCAERGDHALTRLAAAGQTQQPFAAVIVDVRLPDMSGTTLVRALRAQPFAAHTEVLLLGDEASRDAADQAGRFLCKPVARLTLYERLRAAGVIAAAAAVRSDAERPAGAVAGADAKVASQRARRDGAGDRSADGGLAGRRILIVDDHLFNRELARDMLLGLGCEIAVAGHGGEAVERVAAEAFDLVFMDCMMPVMDGYDATRAIRDGGHAYSGVPIIALTANTLDGARERCLAAGMNDYLPKPVKTVDLQAMLTRWLAAVAA